MLLIFEGLLFVTYEDWTGPEDQTLRVFTCRSHRVESRNEEEKNEKEKKDSKSM